MTCLWAPAPQQAPEFFRPVVNDALQRILPIITAPNAKEEDNEMATDNAASALGKILEFHGDAIDGLAVAGIAHVACCFAIAAAAVWVWRGSGCLA